MSLRTRLRRFRFALATLTGLARRGFFIPYRHADSVPKAGHRPEAIAARQAFAEAEPEFVEILADIEALAGDLERIAEPAHDIVLASARITADPTRAAAPGAVMLRMFANPARPLFAVPGLKP